MTDPTPAPDERLDLARTIRARMVAKFGDLADELEDLGEQYAQRARTLATNVGLIAAARMVGSMDGDAAERSINRYAEALESELIAAGYDAQAATVRKVKEGTLFALDLLAGVAVAA